MSLAMILDNRRLEKSRKRQCIRTLEKANADIENYFAQIDAKYLTFYCPSGNKRVFSNQSKGSVWNQGMLLLQKAIQLWGSRVLRII